MSNVIFYTPRTWGVMDRIQGVPKDDAGFYVEAKDFDVVKQQRDDLKSALDLVLSSDMAQREEDEGHLSPVLTAVREVLTKIDNENPGN